MKRLTTSAPALRESLVTQLHGMRGDERTRIYDVTRPPANRAERRMVTHMLRSQQKKQK